MPARIRLQRHGKKNQPFYHIVVADGRAPRDGKFIEKLGTYNPLTNPATIDLNFDRAVEWVKNGAQPSDTVRRILSYKGVLLRRHLQIGVEKGAISQETADVRFNEWLQAKEAKINSKKSDVENNARRRRPTRPRLPPSPPSVRLPPRPPLPPRLRPRPLPKVRLPPPRPRLPPKRNSIKN